jgi:septal ring factor EnvC (AmiA/AmiB activator)
MSIRHDVLETKLLSKFQEALTPAMIEYIVAAVNRELAAQDAAIPRETAALDQERHHIERELSNLVAFVTGGDLQSPRLAEEIQRREQRLGELNQQIRRVQQSTQIAPLQVHRSWVQAKLDHVRGLLASDPPGARRELQKHIEELRVIPVGEQAQRVLKITGRAKVDGLLAEQEAVRLELVAGARNHRYQTCSASTSI